MKGNQQSHSSEFRVHKAIPMQFPRVQMNFLKGSIAMIALFGVISASNVRGQTLSSSYVGLSSFQDVTGTWDNGATQFNYPAGELEFSNLNAFCAEPGVLIGTGLLIYEIQNPSSLANFDTISRLVGGYLASSGADDVAAGFQWAIWEVTNENLQFPWNLSDGNVRVDPLVSASTATLANSYLANVNSFAPASITYLTSLNSQDIVAWNIIPEPSSLGLLVLSGVFLLRRRRA